jgi:hypothetical protein
MWAVAVPSGCAKPPCLEVAAGSGCAQWLCKAALEKSPWGAAARPWEWCGQMWAGNSHMGQLYTWCMAP